MRHARDTSAHTAAYSGGRGSPAAHATSHTHGMATTTKPAAHATTATKSSTASMEAATAGMTSAPTLRE